MTEYSDGYVRALYCIREQLWVHHEPKINLFLGRLKKLRLVATDVLTHKGNQVLARAERSGRLGRIISELTT